MGSDAVQPAGPTSPAQYLSVQTIGDGQMVTILVQGGLVAVTNTGPDGESKWQIDPLKLVIVSISQ